jgi:ubiquitin-protein ligase
MAEKRIARELREIEEARATGQPYACGLAITCENGDLFKWMCTYSCPRHYMLGGVQRVSPYAGLVIRFRIRFPTDYPFKPLKLLTQHSIDFFHPLISCGARTGLCAAFIFGVNFLNVGGWSPAKTVRHVLEDGLLPMWTDGDCWLRTHGPVEGLCSTTRSSAYFFTSDENVAAFPHVLPSFEGDVRPFVEQRVQKRRQAETDRLSRAAEAAARLLEEEMAQRTEQAFQVTIQVHQHRKNGRSWDMQVFPSFRVCRVLEEVKARLNIVGDVAEHQMPLKFAGQVLKSDSSLRDCNIQQGACLDVEKLADFCSSNRCCCEPYSGNGFNAVAADLLLNDVERFERIAHQSWSVQRVPFITHLIGCLSSIILPCPLPLQLQPRAFIPLPVASCRYVQLHQLLVLSGWTTAACRVLMRQSPSTCRMRPAALILFVRRRVLGVAGVQVTAGYDPSAPPLPGTRELSSRGAFVQDELPDVGGRKPDNWFYR